jgi:hypothetical protein
MRRLIGLILAGLGAFLIVIAVVLPTYIDGQVIKFPLNEYETATLTATSASYFSATKVAQVDGANLRAMYTIKGHPNAGSSSTAVWDEFSYVYDTTNREEVQPMSRTFAFDRKTAALVNCCGENINGKSVTQSGIIGYVFPFNTQKKTYQVFDTTLLQAVPMKYTGTDTVNGIQTYKFVENVAPTKIGFSQLSATEPEYYTIHLTYWVDPQTGALLAVNEAQDLYLVNAITGARTTTLFKANLITTPATVAAIVALDNSGRDKLMLLQTILPLVSGIVGALFVAGGFLLYRRPREDVQSGLALATFPSPDAAEAEQAAAAPKQAVHPQHASAPDHATTAPLNGPLVPGMDREQEHAEATEGEGPKAP